MARIQNYAYDQSPKEEDKLLGSSYEGLDNQGRPIYKTRNFKVQDILELAGAQTYTHVQDSAATVWEVNHNLNRYPSATVALSTGQVGMGDVRYINENKLTITFSGDESGKAYIN